jgi:hypothetical protein
MGTGKHPIRAWAAGIPLGCYFGALLILLGVLSNDRRGIFVGLVLVVVVLLARSYGRRRGAID